MTPELADLTGRLLTLRDEIASTPMRDAYGTERRDHWVSRLTTIMREAMYPQPTPPNPEVF